MRKFGLMLAAVFVLVAGATGTAAATLSKGASSEPATSGAAISGLTGKQKQASKKALRKCRKLKSKSRRKSCVKRVKRRFRPAPVISEDPPAATIDVRDKYFSPDVVNIKTGDTILWVWNDINHDAHNVNLVTGPEGVKRLDFSTPSSPSVGFSFKRGFTVPGTYQFVCSIHHLMTMQVDVSK